MCVVLYAGDVGAKWPHGDGFLDCWVLSPVSFEYVHHIYRECQHGTCSHCKYHDKLGLIYGEDESSTITFR